MKAYFMQRLGAYIIDILLVSTLFTLVTMFIPANKNLTNATEEQVKLYETYLKGEISSKEYLTTTVKLDYKVQRNQIPYSILELVFIIVYFIVFQFYNKGQTLGKKLFKIRVVRKDETRISMNDLALRSLVSLNLVSSILTMVFCLVGSLSVYTISSLIIEVIQTTLMIVTVVMVLVRNDGRGLHDFIGGTKVVRV